MPTSSSNSHDLPAVNPTLKRLGFASQDRVVLIHADDIGMSQSTIGALADVMEFGLVSSASVMVPCPWFPAAAAWSREHPDADIGVHLVLTSEWEQYRWRPVSTLDRASGLIDEEGFLHRRTPDVERNAKPEAVLTEVRSQIALARQFGMKPHHMDSHMFSLKRALLPLYLQLSRECQLPCMILRSELAGLGEGFEEEVLQLGLPVFDEVAAVPDRGSPEDRVQLVKAAFSALRPGLTYFILHPSVDTPELRAITPRWQYRVADRNAFLHASVREHIRSAGIHVVSYPGLRGSAVGAP